MPGFIDLDIEIDPEALIDAALDRLRARFPDVEFNEADIVVAALEEMARMAAETGAVAIDVPRAIFRTYGMQVLQVPPIDGAPARMTVTITALDFAGYTMVAGTPIGFRRSGDELWMFTLDIDAVIPADPTITNRSIAGVPVTATEVGADRNLIPAGSVMEQVQSLVWVDSIVTDTESAGGADPETDTQYLNRLAEEQEITTPTPIVPRDFEVLARRVAGVYRAVALDLFDPATGTFDNERHVTVAVVAADGNPVGPATLEAVRALLDSMREINFVVHAIDPTYTAIDITFTAVAVAGANLAAVQAAAIAAVSAHIDPGRWAGGDLSVPEWRRETVVRYTDIVAVIESVPGVSHIRRTAGELDLTINGARTDVALEGAAPLPRRVTADPADSNVDGIVVA